MWALFVEFFLGTNKIVIKTMLLINDSSRRIVMMTKRIMMIAKVVDDLPEAIRTDGAKLKLLENTEWFRLPYPCQLHLTNVTKVISIL